MVQGLGPRPDRRPTRRDAARDYAFSHLGCPRHEDR
jgi:hypothetical protein